MKIVEKLKRIVAAFLAAVLFCSGQAFAAEPAPKILNVGRIRMAANDERGDYPIRIRKGKDFLDSEAYIFAFFRHGLEVREFVEQVDSNTFTVYFINGYVDPQTRKVKTDRYDRFTITLMEDGSVRFLSREPLFYKGSVTHIPTKRSSFCVQVLTGGLPTPKQWRLSAAKISTPPDLTKKGKRIWTFDEFNRYILESPSGHFAYETPESLSIRDRVASSYCIDVSPDVPLGVIYCVFLMHSMSMFDDSYINRDPRIKRRA